jgi:hypothetical protein
MIKKVAGYKVVSAKEKLGGPYKTKKRKRQASQRGRFFKHKKG